MPASARPSSSPVSQATPVTPPPPSTNARPPPESPDATRHLPLPLAVRGAPAPLRCRQSPQRCRRKPAASALTGMKHHRLRLPWSIAYPVVCRHEWGADQDQHDADEWARSAFVCLPLAVWPLFHYTVLTG